jgi:hypothetical protein
MRAAPLFSITTCWPQLSENRWPMARATTSVTPPAAAVTVMVIGRVGYAATASERQEHASQIARPAS